MIMYNIQGRTGINMTAATTLRCAELPGVIGVKEASGDITQIGKTYSAATFLFFETYTVVAFFYLVMTIGLSILVRRLEQRLKRNESH